MSHGHAETLPVIDAHHRVIGVIGRADISRQSASQRVADSRRDLA